MSKSPWDEGSECADIEVVESNVHPISGSGFCLQGAVVIIVIRASPFISSKASHTQHLGYASWCDLYKLRPLSNVQRANHLQKCRAWGILRNNVQ